MPRPRTIQNCCGASKFEVFAALAVIGVLASVLLHRMLYLQEVAEMTAMELTVAHIRTGLRYKTADLLMRDKVSEIASLANENPINWLEAPPEDYLGEFDGAPDANVRGKWYFDKTRRELVYTVNNRRHFVPDHDQNFSLRWHAVRTSAMDARFGGGPDNVQWVALVHTSGGQWF